MRNAKKIIAALFFLIMTLMGCDQKEAKSTPDPAGAYSDWIETTTQEEVHKLLGEPTATLSGFWGDIYAFANGTKLFLYYDADGTVTDIIRYDRNGNETKSLHRNNQ